MRRTAPTDTEEAQAPATRLYVPWIDWNEPWLVSYTALYL
jgi:hypothetical protein